MQVWESIQKSIDFIEENLNEDITIEELSKLSSLSPFYFQRVFSKLVKKPVKEYIKLRRLAKASETLGDKSKRIIDIALDSGFKSHETFTRAFKDAYGITPEKFRDYPLMLNQFDKPDLSLKYTIVDQGVPLESDGMILEMNTRILKEPIYFVGITGFIPIEGQMPLGEATGIDLPGEVWNRFHRQKANIPGRIETAREIGVAYLGNAPKGSFTYFAGAEVELCPEIEGDFQMWQLLPGKYIVCGFEAETFEELVTIAINKAINYCALWLEKHELKTKGYSPEIYYKEPSDLSYMELWMPIEG